MARTAIITDTGTLVYVSGIAGPYAHVLQPMGDGTFYRFVVDVADLTF